MVRGLELWVTDGLEMLRQKPLIGMVSAVLSSALTYLDSMALYMRIAGILLGLIIALLTIYKLVLEVKEKRMSIRKLEHKHKQR